MSITLVRPDGLHITTKATLNQLAHDENLQVFADGLIPRILSHFDLTGEPSLTLAEALHRTGWPAIDALLTGLLVLDAEVNAVIDDETRVFPLPGFLTYRARLPLEQFPLNLMRLPPLNAGGHYRFATVEPYYMTVRLDLHPELMVTGHVRLAAAGPNQPPQRLSLIEARLDRKELDAPLIEAALALGRGPDQPLHAIEATALRQILHAL
ncbi:MAG: hypothetical protein H6632_18985 [Anaerolineales bacterium]|nr:hypothetical protein [Anaerolineales bacterium]